MAELWKQETYKKCVVRVGFSYNNKPVKIKRTCQMTFCSVISLCLPGYCPVMERIYLKGRPDNTELQLKSLRSISELPSVT